VQILGITNEKPHPSGVKLRYKLVQGATAAQATNVFGPVIERIVNDGSVGTNTLIDLDTGKFIKEPSSQGLGLAEALRAEAEYFAKTGADAAGSPPDTSDAPGLMGFDLVALPVVNEMWDTAGPEYMEQQKEMVANVKAG